MGLKPDNSTPSAEVNPLGRSAASDFPAALTVPTSEAPEVYLQRYFGFPSFRSPQGEIVQCMLQGENLLAKLPTGHGKSICYQLPALMLPSGTTIVISPLIALMRDQVKNLREMGIAAVAIHSGQKAKEKRLGLEEVTSGAARILYVSPEKLGGEKFFQALAQVQVSRLVVDEAHCVSIWGHDFRPDYLKIPEARRRLGNPPLSAFTATATPRVTQDILEALQIEGAKVFSISVDRPKLTFEVKRFSSQRRKIDHLLGEVPELVRTQGSGIIYCARVRSVIALSESFAAAGIPHTFYHGKMGSKERTEAEGKYLRDEVPVMIATKAFGMGVDKEDIRWIRHFEITDSIEGYYQEAGRAGRDGDPAHCVLMYQPYDVVVQQRFLEGSNPDLEMIKFTYGAIWRLVKGEKLLLPQPEIKFMQESFLERVGSSLSKRQAMRTALGVLDKTGFISRLQGGYKIKFLIKPSDFAGQDFPLDTEQLNKKLASDTVRLNAMVSYATAGGNHRARILRYFGEKPPQIAEIEKDPGETLATLSIDPGHLRIILEICAHSKSTRQDLMYALLGKPLTTNALRELDRGHALARPDSHWGEIIADIKVVETAKLISFIPLSSKSLAVITEAGIKKLKEFGVELKVPTTHAELKPVILRPDVRQIVRNATADALEELKGMARHPGDWPIVMEWLNGISVPLFDRKIRLSKLVGDFGATPKLPTADIYKDFFKFFFDHKFE